MKKNPKGGSLILKAPIGRGSTGEVYSSLLNGKSVATKRIKFNEDLHENIEKFRKRVKDDFKTLKSLKIENIVKVEDYLFKTENGREVAYIIYELCEGGSLQDLIEGLEIKSMSTIKVLQLFLKLLESLQVLHNNNIVHRALKPTNILFGKKNDEDFKSLKIIDFFFAKYDDICSKTQWGTEIYKAPEILLNDKQDCISMYDKSVDIWSCGVILYEVLYNCYPFSDEELRKKQFSNIKFGEKFQNGEAAPENIIEVCKGMLEVKTSQRPHLEKIIEAFKSFIVEGPKYPLTFLDSSHIPASKSDEGKLETLGEIKIFETKLLTNMKIEEGRKKNFLRLIEEEKKLKGNLDKYFKKVDFWKKFASLIETTIEQLSYNNEKNFSKMNNNEIMSIYMNIKKVNRNSIDLEQHHMYGFFEFFKKVFYDIPNFSNYKEINSNYDSYLRLGISGDLNYIEDYLLE